MASRVKLPNACANALLAGWILAEVVRIAHLAESLEVRAAEYLVAVALVAAIGFVVARPAPRLEDRSLATLAIVVAAVAFPFLYQLLPAGSSPGIAGAGATAIAVQACAALVMLLATCTLGRNYSILPQFRWLVVGGPYAVVRHPLYAAYLAFDATLAMQAGAAGLGLWLVEAGLLYWRAGREEDVLARADPVRFAAYTARVRWRFFPGIV